MPVFEVVLIAVNPETKAESLIADKPFILVAPTAELAGQKVLVESKSLFISTTDTLNVRVLSRPFTVLPQWK